jgi:hypothetical protein
MTPGPLSDRRVRPIQMVLLSGRSAEIDRDEPPEVQAKAAFPGGSPAVHLWPRMNLRGSPPARPKVLDSDYPWKNRSDGQFDIPLCRELAKSANEAENLVIPSANGSGSGDGNAVGEARPDWARRMGTSHHATSRWWEAPHLSNEAELCTETLTQ